MCASEGDLCYPLHNAARPMTEPKKTEDQELSLDQLKDAAGGAEQYCGNSLGEISVSELRSTKRPAKPKDNLGTNKPGTDVI